MSNEETMSEAQESSASVEDDQPPPTAMDVAADEPEIRLPQLDPWGRAYATGKRKNAIARVWLKPGGSGKVTINGRGLSEYFGRETLSTLVLRPLTLADRVGSYDIMATACGGGLSGQAGAICHAIAKALNAGEPLLRPLLKSHGLLTRDSRIVERKKYGHRKARRSFQFSKR